MGLLADAQAMLVGTMKEAAAGPLPTTYAGPSRQGNTTPRPNLATTPVVMWPGKTDYVREPAETGASTTNMERDYLFLAADWITAFGSAAWPPQTGDRITDPNVLDPGTGQSTVFELVNVPGEPPWRYSDLVGRTTVRVHTRRVS